MCKMKLLTECFERSVAQEERVNVIGGVAANKRLLRSSYVKRLDGRTDDAYACAVGSIHGETGYVPTSDDREAPDAHDKVVHCRVLEA